MITLWKGTLEEGDITPDEDMVRLVKDVTNRGIVNTIVSKDYYEYVRLTSLAHGGYVS